MIGNVWEEISCSSLRYSPDIYLGGLRKPTKVFSQIDVSEQRFEPETSENEPEMLITRPRPSTSISSFLQPTVHL
jgi:hypothetical protein